MPSHPLLHELSLLDAAPPADFVAGRRRLIARLLDEAGGGAEHLQALQSSVEQTLALCATPGNRLRQLNDMLDERLEALLALSGRLDDEISRQGLDHDHPAGC